MPNQDTALGQLLPSRVVKAFAARDIRTAGDLLWFLPHRFVDQHTDLTTVLPGSYVVVVAEVTSAVRKPMRTRRGHMLLAQITTSHGQSVGLTFFRAYGHEKALRPGRRGVFAGEVSVFNGHLQLAHPAYEMFGDGEDFGESDGLDAGDIASAKAAADRALMPVYSRTKGLATWTISRCVETVLNRVTLEDALPESIRAARDLPSSVEAMRLSHFPESLADLRRARRRLAYDEALTLQLILAQRRAAQASAEGVARRPRPDGLVERFDATFPFPLTDGQRRVGEEIAADLAKARPMHRLLQGEVGSGKTLVAVRAMLSVVDSGGQAALLAPTEVLAAQHYRSIRGLLGPLADGPLFGEGTQVALLTGSQSSAARAEALRLAATGEAGIVIGTHALIQEAVAFEDLALVVVDEQHRFGVEQRDALRAKATHVPHTLVMTATPIPRTVAMTVFGDMETSVLTELPAGRSPITTHLVDNPAWYDRAFARVAEEVRQGRQAYVVCPRIDDGLAGDEEGTAYASGRPTDVDALERLDGGESAGGADDAGQDEDDTPRQLRSVHEVAAELGARPDFAGIRLGVLHSRLPTEAKDEVMADFAGGRCDVLVATTVIEVGVDVPNATVMVVMDADRFGVSQLHQLRGRIGRGGHPGLCLLVNGDARLGPWPESETASVRRRRASKPGVLYIDSAPEASIEPISGSAGPAARRLSAVASTTDGFALAQVDLETRREGDILGSRQWGRGSSVRRQLRILRDDDLIAAARADAAALIEDDVTLAGYPALARVVAERLDDEQAAYLERG